MQITEKIKKKQRKSGRCLWWQHTQSSNVFIKYPVT